ncbi:MAG TPA: MarR family transcriptional regulator [Rhodanobacter sp.]|jgi:Transcriptional regulators|nr:MarR family transcriptional regulator [Rhodanobacter sp.]
MKIPPDPVPCSGATLGLLFRQVRDAMWARMAEELDTLGHELTFSQYMTLKKLADGTTAGVTDLARTVDLNPGAMTRLLDKLEAKGLIARVADAGDRRALNIHLTEAGLAIWQDINQCGMRVRERAMHGMSEAERDQLTRLITQVRNNLSPSGS